MLTGALPVLLPAPVVGGNPARAARLAAPSYIQVNPPCSAEFMRYLWSGQLSRFWASGLLVGSMPNTRASIGRGDAVLCRLAHQVRLGVRPPTLTSMVSGISGSMQREVEPLQLQPAVSRHRTPGATSTCHSLSAAGLPFGTLSKQQYGVVQLCRP